MCTNRIYCKLVSCKEHQEVESSQRERMNTFKWRFRFVTEFPKILMILGGVLFAAGLIFQLVGKLPGDIFCEKGNVTFFFL
ncbi:DUF2905 domain-containing protein [Bacillus sp. SL00103]